MPPRLRGSSFTLIVNRYAATYVCTNASVMATDQALRAAGGFALTRKLPLERFFCDACAGFMHPPNDDAALELVGHMALLVV